ncbi:MAG: triacylglycerol lipase [Ramalina farinacea]|uniref:Triacylglycerol lipase n=1 Tax=Ramalina farinacea TaxID=258253 RepID=A0AA43QQ26_9LECA|nr:triacylglycerol lipase [Ramalina farinacea]
MPLNSILGVLADVGSYWQTRKKPLNTLLDTLANAQTYDEWETAAFQLDELLHTDLWRQNASSKYYDFRLIHERRKAIIHAREEEDILGLVNLLRSGLVRNLGNITTPKLFNRAYAGTKILIEEYITQVALAIEYVTALPTTQSSESGWTSQAKLDLLHDTRQAFGRSTLVLQGGAIFGLCHIGVVKALHLRGLLPRIIVGTATGALIAALVGIHTEDELLDFLNGDGIDLTAFANPSHPGTDNDDKQDLIATHRPGTLQTLLRRTIRYIREGHLLDVNILEECVRANVGDLTFEEAYARTKRVLNITVPTSGRGGVPNLLNYLTAPNVLIWSAALASNTTSHALYQPMTILCKDETGRITPWSSSHAQSLTFQPQHHIPPTHHLNERDSPLSRVAELFNVNHFIVSQARPYIAPFLRSDLQHPSSPRQARRTGITLPLLRLATQEVHHRLNQLDALGLLPVTIRRLLLDETVPGASLTLVPDLQPTDFLRLLETPTREGLEYWISQGERSVWPNVSLLRVRCAIEVELDRCYQLVRRRKPLDAMGGGPEHVVGSGALELPVKARDDGGGGARKRVRASSVGQE